MKTNYEKPATEVVECRLEANLLASNYTSSSTDMDVTEVDVDWEY